MDNLKILYLYSNKIQKIQNKTFDNLKSLEELRLDRK
jgi:Leucine-rich repeat (LRR) protein